MSKNISAVLSKNFPIISYISSCHNPVYLFTGFWEKWNLSRIRWGVKTPKNRRPHVREFNVQFFETKRIFSHGTSPSFLFNNVEIHRHFFVLKNFVFSIEFEIKIFLPCSVVVGTSVETQNKETWREWTKKEDFPTYKWLF